MNCGKTTQILNIAHNYEREGYKILVLKPSKDSKGDKDIVSRFGGDEATRECDFLITPDMDIAKYLLENYGGDIDCILVDEAQFLSPKNVVSLRRVAGEFKVPVMTFGLKIDFKGEPFEGMSWLFANAQDIEELGTRTLCSCCKKGKRGTMNVRKVNGEITFEGEQVGIDGTDSIEYEVVCLDCFMKVYNEWLNKQRITSQIDYRGGLING